MIESTVRACLVCDRTFESTRGAQQVYCSLTCRRVKDRSKAPITLGTGLGIASGTVGALAELLVAVDLVRRGYHVFRAVGPHGPCDLVAFRSGEATIRVEVKSGYIQRGGGLAYARPTSEDFDVLAVVLPDNRIVYRPDL